MQLMHIYKIIGLCFLIVLGCAVNSHAYAKTETALTEETAPNAEDNAADSIVVGYVENVFVEAIDNKIKAKLDTGAKTSSIHAEIIEIKEYEEKGKKDDVIFKLIIDKEGNTKQMKYPVKRYVRIKKRDGGYFRRPVIEMNLCIAGVAIEEEVNLAERDVFIYDLLVGRNMLAKGHLAVDSSKAFTARPNCPSFETSE